MQEKIVKFTDLVAWKEGHGLVLESYKIIRKFPKEETFGLTSQMRRCAVSITSNIAEGFSRYSPKDKNQFYFIALGSITELQNQLLIARDLRYTDNDIFAKIAERTVLVHKLVNGLIKSNKIKYEERNRS